LILDPDAAYPSTIEPRLYRHHLIRLKHSLTSWRKDGFFMDIEPNSMTGSVTVLVFKSFTGKDGTNDPIDMGAGHAFAHRIDTSTLSLSHSVVQMSILN
jgi:hypothetical protein